MSSIKDAKQYIMDGIKVYLLKDDKGNYLMNEVNRLPFYLEGCPGIGKTEIVSQIAKELELGFVSFSLTHHTRNSLLGLPVIKDLDCGKYTEYTMSEIIAKVMEAKESGYEEGILLLDEFSCVSDSILPAMLAFLQTKNIGAHSLPEGWVIVLCGNPPEYNKSARRFDAAILDRIRRISIELDQEVFLDYAINKNYHDNIVQYIKLNPDDMYKVSSKKGEESLVTCRGWENLSHAIKGMESIGKNINEDLVSQFIKDEKIAAEFTRFWLLNKVGLTTKDIDDILNGRLKKYYDRYKDEDYRVWWNALEVITAHIDSNHKGLNDKLQYMTLANDILEELKNSNYVYQQIYDRINNKNGLFDGGSGIDRWSTNSNRFENKTPLEDKLLNSWLNVLEEYEYENDIDFYTEEYQDDEMVLSIIAGSCKEYENEANIEMKQLGKEMGNVLKLARMKDETLAEKIYHIINHNPMFVRAMHYSKNKDYIQLCKENYAVGA